MRHKKSAFTLIELFIVIIVVIILSTMLMLAGGESQAAAKATRIVNGLTDLKMFALTWYRNNLNKFDKDGKFHKAGDLTKDAQDLQTYFATDEGQAEIKNFLTGDFLISYASNSGGYGILNDQTSEDKPAWYACYHLESNTERSKIKPKLEDKANNSSQTILLQKDGDKKWKTYKDANEIYTQILVFNY